MTNTPLKTKLVYIMEQEKRTKINLIGAILDTKQGKGIDLNAEFNKLYDMSIIQLNQVINNLIFEILQDIKEFKELKTK
jgi:hypothetical protein